MLVAERGHPFVLFIFYHLGLHVEKSNFTDDWNLVQNIQKFKPVIVDGAIASILTMVAQLIVYEGPHFRPSEVGGWVKESGDGSS